MKEKLEEPEDSIVGEAYSELAEIKLGGVSPLGILLVLQFLSLVAWDYGLPNEFPAADIVWPIIYAAIVIPFLGVMYLGFTGNQPVVRRIQMVAYSISIVAFFAFDFGGT